MGKAERAAVPRKAPPLSPGSAHQQPSVSQPGQFVDFISQNCWAGLRILGLEVLINQKWPRLWNPEVNWNEL